MGNCENTWQKQKTITIQYTGIKRAIVTINIWSRGIQPFEHRVTKNVFKETESADFITN